MLKLYRTFSDGNSLSAILKAKEGKVIKILDANFGVLEAGTIF
jgi:hypothetical protein